LTMLAGGRPLGPPSPGTEFHSRGSLSRLPTTRPLGPPTPGTAGISRGSLAKRA
jgi:hypothetical protein